MEMEAPIPRRRNLEDFKNKKMGIIITLLIVLNILALIEILGCRTNTKPKEDTIPSEKSDTTPTTTQHTQTKSTNIETKDTKNDQEIIIKKTLETTAKIITTTIRPTTTENEIVKNLLEMLKD